MHSAAWLGFSLSAAAFIISLIINKKLKYAFSLLIIVILFINTLIIREANEKIFPPVEVKKSMSVEV